MNASDSPRPRLQSSYSGLRAGLLWAALMLTVPFIARFATRLGWSHDPGLAQRLLMVLVAGFIVSTGNTIPKRLASWACAADSAARVQAFQRFAGWVWVLAGLALALAWLVLPEHAATLVTFVAMPGAIVLVALRWLGLRTSPQRPA